MLKLLPTVFVPSLAFTENETVVSLVTSFGFPVIWPLEEFKANPAPDKFDVLSVKVTVPPSGSVALNVKWVASA